MCNTQRFSPSCRGGLLPPGCRQGTARHPGLAPGAAGLRREMTEVGSGSVPLPGAQRAPLPGGSGLRSATRPGGAPHPSGRGGGRGGGPVGRGGLQAPPRRAV